MSHDLGKFLLVLTLSSLGACARAPVVFESRRLEVVPTDAWLAVRSRNETARRKRELEERRSRAFHLLSRFAFGPRPGDVQRLVAGSPQGWFEEQLDAAERPDPEGREAVSPHLAAFSAPAELPSLYPRDVPEMEGISMRSYMKRTDTDAMLQDLQRAIIKRYAASNHQLREVMSDFFCNHFNVYAKKGEVRLLVGDYVERAIRPHVLGRFEDLLVATARHPAMLYYLDNIKSTKAATRKGKKRGGINENYARELLELHTLGVDGGYTQMDVENAALILTGWTVSVSATEGPAFRFDSRAHDKQEKRVLGTTYAAGGGEEEGMRMLGELARHPSTARHLATKLCRRFVADEPPPSCIRSVAGAYLDSDTDIRAALRALFQSDAFWDPAVRRNKLKSPLEFLVSALRAVGAEFTPSVDLSKMAVRLGEAPLLESRPTGYPEHAAAWLSNGPLERSHFAFDLVLGQEPGIRIEPELLLEGLTEPHAIAAHLNASLLAGAARDSTLVAIEGQLAAGDDPGRHELAIALALSSAEFQWQ